MAKRRTGITAGIKSIIAVSVGALLPYVAAAAMITVNTSADNTTAADGQCTLREALANVNAAADTTSGDCVAGTGAGDTVTFNLTLPAKIKLTLGQLVIEQNVTIAGPTLGALHLSGEHTNRVFSITAGTTSIADVIIEHGRPNNGGGGAIANAGTLTLTNCRLKGNKSIPYGGAITNTGTLTLINCTLENNQVARVGPGGHVGGAIDNGGTMTLTNCTLKNNKSSQGGGIYNTGTTALINCTLTGNRGRAGAAGGILNLGTVTLTNCTLDRNMAFAGRGSLGGGGIWHSSFSLGTATLTNTIVAHSGKGRNCGGDPITSNGHNLSSDSTCFTSGGTDLVNTDPMLGRLANYGGPTATLALCSGVGLPRRSCTGASPAMDAGDDAVSGPPDNLTTDQRGLPRQAGLHVDIGAYEVQ